MICVSRYLSCLSVDPQGFTFLTGAAGVHALGAAVAQRTGDSAACRRHAREVAAMEELGIYRRSCNRTFLKKNRVEKAK